MRKKLLNTKVTVKLRKSEYKEEWYLIVEAYPVNDPCNPKHKRVVESINRIIRTPIWDKSSVIGITPDGDYKYRPKRDANGVILCSSQLDQESCIYTMLFWDIPNYVQSLVSEHMWILVPENH